MGRIKADAQDLLRRLPRVDQTLDHADAAPLLERYGRTRATEAVREAIERLRESARRGEARADQMSPAAVLGTARELLARAGAPALARAINATGVILHTGLGRAVLPSEALRAIVEEQSGYSLLEVDRATGERGVRETHVSALLCRLSGAEAATVVNNNAGATLIALHALARGREVIVSRGQLVEIGGSFRIPEVMAQSGARLVEVGTTNKTRRADYEAALAPETALLLRVHTSNFKIVGFAESVSLEDLVEMGARRKIHVMDDLGSGSLLDLSPYGLAGEPTVQDSVRAGADVVTFSGDKLLGGPQAGLIVGKSAAVGAIRKDPLFRALRPDKLTLTALEATLKLFLEPELLARRHPVFAMLTATPRDLEPRALELAAALQKIDGLDVKVLRDVSEVGGGSVPGQHLETFAVSVRRRGTSPDDLASLLRRAEPPIFARIQEDAVRMDVRTLLPGDADAVVAAFRALP
jgi:L-seryl-tRNA(Ser) seleniumtransferase